MEEHQMQTVSCISLAYEVSWWQTPVYVHYVSPVLEFLVSSTQCFSTCSWAEHNVGTTCISLFLSFQSPLDCLHSLGQVASCKIQKGRLKNHIDTCVWQIGIKSRNLAWFVFVHKSTHSSRILVLDKNMYVMWSVKNRHMSQRVKLQNKGNKQQNSNVFHYFYNLWTSVNVDTSIRGDPSKKFWKENISHDTNYNSKCQFCTMWQVFSDHITYAFINNDSWSFEWDCW